jgi:hypothetical protein
VRAQNDLCDYFLPGRRAVRDVAAGESRRLYIAVCLRDVHYHFDVRRGFASIPAIWPTSLVHKWVGAIHGRLLTAWSAAGISGPVLVNYLRSIS